MDQITPTLKGLITGALMVIASAFSLYVLKNPVESNFQMVVYGIFCLGIIWSLWTYSKTAIEKKAFKDFFSIGFKTFIVITLIMAVFTFIYFSLHSQFRDEKIAENSRLLLLEGNHLPKEIEENAKQLRKMFMPMMISAAVFRYLILGSLITLQISIFASTKGRVSKREFWQTFLILIILNLIISVVISILSLPLLVNLVISFLVQIYLTILGIKRMHDINKSGIYYFIPFYNLFLALGRGTIGENQYGSDPKYPIN